MKRIITISREFGSGGRTIAKQVAENLGYAYYDKELIEEIAMETGFSKDYIEKRGEYASGTNIFSYAFIGRSPNGSSIEDQLWAKQQEIILHLAEKGNCVIVGRSADYILKNHTDCLNAFIHASTEKKVKRIVEVYRETDVAPEKRLRDKDKKRAANYRYYTDRRWGQAKNYHLCLDSGEFGLDGCTKIICELAK